MARPRKFKDFAELDQRIDAYLDADSSPKHLAGLAVALGVCRDTLSVYARGDYDTADAQFSDTIKRAKTWIEADKLSRALVGEYKPAVAIFDLKNNHGYADKREITGGQGEALIPRAMQESPTLEEINEELKRRGLPELSLTQNG